MKLIQQNPEEVVALSLPVRGAWVEIERCAMALRYSASLPVRGAWVEIGTIACVRAGACVAPRAGSVG